MAATSAMPDGGACHARRWDRHASWQCMPWHQWDGTQFHFGPCAHVPGPNPVLLCPQALP